MVFFEEKTKKDIPETISLNFYSDGKKSCLNLKMAEETKTNHGENKLNNI